MKHLLWIALFGTLTSLASQQNNSNNFVGIQQWAKDFYIGAASGTVGMTVYAPFHYAQNRRIQRLGILLNKQAQLSAPKSLQANIKQIMSGSRALIFGKVPAIAIQQAGYAGIIRKLESEGTAASETEKLGANITAAIFSAPVANASQLVALHQENQKEKCNILKTIHSFPRGYKDLSRGLGPVMVRETLFMLIFNQLLPKVKNETQKITNDEAMAYLISAPIAGALVTGCTQPANVNVTYLHADIAQKKYKGFWSFMDAYHAMKSKGIVAESFRGTGLRAPGVMLGLAAMNKAKEEMLSAQNNVKL
ncbi:MAG TPA: hypothetical protein VGT41_04175 [Candidatus Babeliales bacterium]|nr:hypothetical protein [Candidatus Babeliales bacterium]